MEMTISQLGGCKETGFTKINTLKTQFAKRRRYSTKTIIETNDYREHIDLAPIHPIYTSTRRLSMPLVYRRDKPWNSFGSHQKTIWKNKKVIACPLHCLLLQLLGGDIFSSFLYFFLSFHFFFFVSDLLLLLVIFLSLFRTFSLSFNSVLLFVFFFRFFVFSPIAVSCLILSDKKDGIIHSFFLSYQLFILFPFLSSFLSSFLLFFLSLLSIPSSLWTNKCDER